jgi:hypothetical protein
MRALLLLLLLTSPAIARAAGNVQAVVTDNVLEVTGDGEANVFRITPGLAPDAMVVSGVEGTTVNGGVALVGLANVDSIRIDGGKGDDRVELSQLDLRDRLTVKLGPGRNALVAQDVRVHGLARIKGGGEGDDITVRGFTRFSDRLTIQTGGDADAVTLTNVGLEAGLRVDTGGGSDTVLVQFCEVSAGDEMRVRSGGGGDAVTVVGSHFLGEAKLDLGGGADGLLVQDCNFEDAFKGDGGAGRDQLDFDGTNTFDPLEPRRIISFETLA